MRLRRAAACEPGEADGAGERDDPTAAALGFFSTPLFYYISPCRPAHGFGLGILKDRPILA